MLASVLSLSCTPNPKKDSFSDTKVQVGKKRKGNFKYPRESKEEAERGYIRGIFLQSVTHSTLITGDDSWKTALCLD